MKDTTYDLDTLTEMMLDMSVGQFNKEQRTLQLMTGKKGMEDFFRAMEEGFNFDMLNAFKELHNEEG